MKVVLKSRADGAGVAIFAIFRDNVPEDSTSTGLHIDHKRLQALQEKRIALGHKPNDHVEQMMGGMTMR